ncbi:MAG: hypothetical protein MZV70_39375 [Desulfobacterales bacterium]|nr:hypothetical protein [Desulfobacterales bacterium]
MMKTNFEKKEIDIAVTSSAGDRLSALELKYPRNGQVPESMFGFCKDIAFLEQLVSSGFQSACFLAVADDKLFYSGSSEGIYGLFRSGTPITGTITKPTGDKDSKVTINGSYTASWLPVSGIQSSASSKWETSQVTITPDANHGAQPVIANCACTHD